MTMPRLAAVDAAVGLWANLRVNLGRLAGDAARDARAIAREAERSYAGLTGGASSALRAAPRFARIAGEAARLLARYRALGTVAPRVSPAVAAALRADLDRDAARRVYELCVELRGGVLKVGQFASCRIDLLPDVWARELARLQDQVPPVPLPGIVARVEAELGRPTAELYASFAETPIAAASLAQVHAATLPDGTAVAVKVQVPGIEELVEIDAAAVRLLGGALRELLPTDVETVASELARAVRAELDYRAEADNAGAFAACFAGDERVVVPRVHASHSRGRVLTMERLEGARLVDFLDGATPAERERVLATLVDVTCAQVLVHGLFHGDPHPGNFLVLPGLRLGVLDFGCVRRVPATVRRAYAEIVGAVVAGQRDRMADILARLGFQTADGDPAALGEYADLLLEAFREGATIESLGDPRIQLARSLAIARAHPMVRVPDDFVLLGRVFGALGGLLLRYQPRIDLFRLVAPHLAQALALPAAA